MSMCNISIKGYVCLNSGYENDIMFVKTREEQLMSERVGKFFFVFCTEEDLANSSRSFKCVFLS